MSGEYSGESKRVTTLVIGVGNRYREDDAIGLLVAQQLRGRVPPGVRVVELSGEASELMREWRGAESVIVVDAVRSQDEPGHVHRINLRDAQLPAGRFHFSGHAFGVAEATELARTLGELPAQLVLYAVTGERFGTGTEVSPPVEAAGSRVVGDVLAELAKPREKASI